MTNAIVAATNQVDVINGLDVVKQVSEFYSGAFDQLLRVGSVLAALIGIGLPLLIQFYQKRELRIQKSQLKSEMDQSLQALLLKTKTELADEIQRKFEAQKVDLEKAFTTESALLKKRLIEAEGFCFELQGGYAMKSEDYRTATESYCDAVLKYCECESGSDVSRVMTEHLAEYALLQIKKSDFDDNLNKKLEKVKEQVKKTDKQGYTVRSVEKLEIAIEIARKRA